MATPRLCLSLRQAQSKLRNAHIRPKAQSELRNALQRIQRNTQSKLRYALQLGQRQMTPRSATKMCITHMKVTCG